MKKYSIFLKIILILLVFIVFSSCQHKIVNIRKFPDKFYDVLPIETKGDLCVIDKVTESITIEKNNVKIKVRYIDFDFLFNNFSYIATKNDFGYVSIYRLVPFYIAMRSDGKSDVENYFSDYTVFYINIENNSDTPIVFNQKRSVMVDAIGNQYTALDDIFFKSNQLLYGYMEEAPFSGIKKTISPLTKILGEISDLANAAASITPYGMVKLKTGEGYDESKRYDYKYPMDEKLFLQGGEIFPSVSYSGFMVFRKISDKSFSFKLIIPHITCKSDVDGKTQEINFDFNFSKVMIPKKAYFDSSAQTILYKSVDSGEIIINNNK